MNQNKLLYMLAGLIVSFLLFNCRAQGNKDHGSPALKEIVCDSTTLLVDVRTNLEFQEGHVEGSINIPLDELESSLEKLENKEAIVVFCASGGRSGRALELLKKYDIKAINGGSWQNINNLRKK